MINIAICDDDMTIIEQVSKYIKDFATTVQDEINIKIYNDGVDFISDINGMGFDLLFLDIDMPVISGMEVAEHDPIN